MTKEHLSQYEQILRSRTPPEVAWVEAGIPMRFHAASFDTYETTTQGQRDALNWASNYAASFADALSDGTSALLCGRTGTGKTHLAVAIAKHVMQRQCSARYATVHSAVREVKDTWGKEATSSHGNAVKRFTKPDLLILDEVGVQFGSDTERLILFEILNDRYNEMRPTILLSNLPRDGVAQFLGDRVVDRMRENGGTLMVFDWESHRGQA